MPSWMLILIEDVDMLFLGTEVMLLLHVRTLLEIQFVSKGFSLSLATLGHYEAKISIFTNKTCICQPEVRMNLGLNWGNK